MIEEQPGARVVPFDTDLIKLPDAVADASEDFRTALARVTAVRGAVAATRAALDSARTTDEAAARDAVAAGRTPPAATIAKAADALDRAQRSVPAAEQLARAAQAHYLDVCSSHFDELTAALRDRRQTVRDEGLLALAVVAQAIRDTIALDELATEMNIDSIRARRAAFRPVRHTRRKDPADEALAAARAALGERPAGNRFMTGPAAA